MPFVGFPSNAGTYDSAESTEANADNALFKEPSSLPCQRYFPNPLFEWTP